MDRQYRARRGQAIVFVALTMVVLCGMAAVGVDVGMATSKQHLLRNAASTAALDARQLFADHASSVAPTNSMVWNSIQASLADSGLSVRNATGADAPADPCAAGYTGNQVALTAIYLNGQNAPIIEGGSPVTITDSSPTSVPDGAAGVQIGLGACQPAAFGGVIGHPRYTIEVNTLAGQPSIAATNTPGPTETSYPTDTPTNTPTSTPTNTPTTTPTSTATPTPAPTRCTVRISIPSPLDQGTGYYTTFTTSASGDITATWTITTQSSSSTGQVDLYLYRGTPTLLTAGSNPSTTDPTTVTPVSDTVSLRATNSMQTETLDYTTDPNSTPQGQQAAAGTYTVYFFNGNNHDNVVSGATVSYMSSSCPGSPTATPTTGPSATPTTSPTSTATVTPSPTATATPPLVPYAVSAAPDGLWCNGKVPPIQPEIEPTGSRDAKYLPDEYYCPGVYSIGSHVVVYANGVGVGSNYGHDANFKGYIGNTSVWRGLTKNAGSSTAVAQLFNDEVDNPQPSGGGDNRPSAPCPATIRLPLISRVAHHGNADWFAPLGIIEVTIDNPASCGNPTTGVISGVICDGTPGHPDYIVNLPTPAPSC